MGNRLNVELPKRDNDRRPNDRRSDNRRSDDRSFPRDRESSFNRSEQKPRVMSGEHSVFIKNLPFRMDE